MTATTPVSELLANLHRCHQTVSDAFYDASILKTAENEREIGLLRHWRMLSPDVRDTYRIRGSLRQFLNTVISTVRLYAVGANIGEHFGRISKLIDEHAYAYNEARDADCERYEVEIREAINDVADAIEDDLSFLEMLVATKFGAVSTLAEKTRQNKYYLDRTKKLQTLLGNLHFSRFGDQLDGNADLALSFKILLEERLPIFNEQLKAIIFQLNQHLFGFRRIEERFKTLRRLAQHYSRHPNWQLQDWDAASSPPEWLLLARPLNVSSAPDTRQPESEEMLFEVAKSIPSTTGIKTERRPVGALISDVPEERIVVPPPPIQVALKSFIRAGRVSKRWLSARAWWLEHHALMDGISENVWLLRVLSETDKADSKRLWKFHFDSTRPDGFNGNLLIRDIHIAPLEAPRFEHA